VDFFPFLFLKCMYKKHSIHFWVFFPFFLCFFFQICVMHPQTPWYIQLRVQGENNERIRSWVRSLARNTSGVEDHARALEWGLGQMISESIIHIDLHKPNNKLVNALLEHFWCINESLTNIDSQDSPWPRLRGRHHLPLYSILYAWPWGLHPNVILSCDSQVPELGVSKFPIWGLLWLWRPIILFVNLQLKWGLK
jgi:hypothetical protein